VLFISQLVAVSPPEHIELACADHKLANSALLDVRKPHFHCSHQQRRSEARLRLPPNAATLRCDVSLGALSFEADITDFSMSGMGMITYDAGIRLEPGMRIEDVRIVNRGHAPVLVSLEIRHVAKVLLPDGRLAHRAGCRIRAAQQVMEKLARAFMIKLE
jgi:hypothetical protein